MTLLIPIIILFVYLIVGFVSRGVEYFDIISQTLLANWYHILPGIIGLFIGIELFKNKLTDDSLSSPNFRTAVKFVFKLWIIEAIISILTNILAGTIKFSDNDYLGRLIILIAVFFILYFIVAALSSLLIGGIIYKFGIEKVTNTLYSK